MTTLIFEIPPHLWLTSNRHSANRFHRAAIVRGLHDLAATVATNKQLQPLAGPVTADWTVQYPKGVRRDKGDAANAQPTTKALLDGLVPDWLPDDGPLHVIRESFQRGPNLTVPHLHAIRLVLTDQEVPF